MVLGYGGIQHDWMLCALSAKTGEKVYFSTRGMFGKDQLVDWLNAEHPLLVGYNCKHYDQYILKGNSLWRKSRGCARCVRCNHRGW